MKVFLRMGSPERYYAGHEHWVPDREHALDLETIERAIEVGRDGDLDAMLVVVSSGHPGSDWFMPLRRRASVPAQAAPANDQSPLRKAA